MSVPKKLKLSRFSNQFIFLSALFFNIILVAIPGHSICTYQISEGDRPEILSETVQRIFKISTQSTRVDFKKSKNWCQFKIYSSGQLVSEVEVTAKKCQTIDLEFQFNLIGYSCSSDGSDADLGSL